MKTIVYFITDLSACGGKEKIISMKANYLAEHGWNVYVVQTNQSGDKPYFELHPNVHLENLKISYAPNSSFYPLVFLRRKKTRRMHFQKCEQLLRQANADIAVSTFDDEMRFLHRINDKSIKVLEYHTARFFLFLKNRSVRDWCRSLIHSLYKTIRDPHIAKKYDAFVCLTEGDALSWGRMKNLHVIGNAITIPQTPPASLDNHRIIAVGRLHATKQFDILIRCWSKIPQKVRQDWTLEIFGDGEEKQQLEEQIKSLFLQQSVTIHPPVMNIAKEYQDSSIYCMTSKAEGFCLALCEAMSVGLPSVVFDCPSGPRDIIRNESMGMLVPMGREDLFVEKLQLLMTDTKLRKSMGDEARRSVYERYSMDAIMQQWETLFQELEVTNN